MKLTFASFITWKIWLFVFLFFGAVFIPQKFNFLGGGFEHYIRFPWFWAWGNFDGEHYLAIAQHNYGNGEQAFFPLYPLIMKVLSWPRLGDLYFLQIIGLLISNTSFIIGLIGLWKLITIDFKKSIADLTTLILLVFPTSFYFSTVYTESLFFSIIIWSFYFARKNNWLLAGILGGLASATRFSGIILLPVLLIEWLIQKKKFRYGVFGIFLVPLGLIAYMYYLKQTTGDYLAFVHTLTWFGEQRSSTPILLPQVFWRYLKIIVDVQKTDPLFFTIIIESITSILFLVLSILGFIKLRLSYALWLVLGYILPTLSGSFSSLPRYVLTLFPAFLIMAIFLDRQKKYLKIIVLFFLFILLGISTAMFTRGYWIA